LRAAGLLAEGIESVALAAAGADLRLADLDQIVAGPETENGL
jgi:hypothetical protein